MTLVPRALRFSLVGIAGAAVQLGAVVVLHRMMPRHYLVDAGLALEITLLHNFLWHRRYTWRDRSAQNSAWRQLVRFHVANGLVSLGGNLALVRLLVGAAHAPVVLADAAAILPCSLVNFGLGQRWVFAVRSFGCDGGVCAPPG